LGVRKRVAVVADSNFLILLAEGKITPSMIIEAVDYAYELYVPRAVLEELSRIESSAPQLKVRRLAARARRLLEEGVIQARIVEEDAHEPVDDYLVNLALRMKRDGLEVIVATSDRELRRKLRRRGVPSLFYREEGRRLVAEWFNP